MLQWLLSIASFMTQWSYLVMTHWILGRYLHLTYHFKQKINLFIFHQNTGSLSLKITTSPKLPIRDTFASLLYLFHVFGNLLRMCVKQTCFYSLRLSTWSSIETLIWIGHFTPFFLQFLFSLQSFECCCEFENFVQRRRDFIHKMSTMHAWASILNQFAGLDNAYCWSVRDESKWLSYS